MKIVFDLKIINFNNNSYQIDLIENIWHLIKIIKIIWIDQQWKLNAGQCLYLVFLIWKKSLFIVNFLNQPLNKLSLHIDAIINCHKWL